MRRARRVITVLFAVLLVGIVALALRTLDALGLFTEVTHVACEDKTFIGGVGGVDDMQFDAATNSLFIAVTDERAELSSRSSSGDGIYVLRPGRTGKPFKLAGTDADFHPSALSMFRDADGSLTLMALSQPSHGNAVVDVLDVSDPSSDKVALHERESISSDLLVAPGGLTAVDKSRFYVTNIQTSKTFLGRLLEVHLLLPRANIVYFDGANFRIAADGLRMPSGMARSPDGSKLYVGEMTGREIRTYAREPFSGDITLVNEMPIESGINDIHVVANGNLFAVGQPKLAELLLYSHDAHKPSPSEVFRIPVGSNGIPQSAIRAYAGTDIGAAGVSILVGNRLLVGSGLSPKIMSCAEAR
jgi:hypothetical protein